MAVVTTIRDKEKIAGDIPIFIAENQEEKEQIARYLSKTLDAMVHDLGNGLYYIVKH